MDDRRQRGVPFVRWGSLAAIAAFTLASAASAETLSPRVNAVLDKAAEQLRNASVSIHVAEITSRGVLDLYSHHPDLPLAPASNTKLMTTAAAFERYGAKAAFKTVLYKVGEDLLLVGGGDPGLGDAKLLAAQGLKPTAPFEEMAAELKKAGVATFRDLIIDDRVFDNEFVHPAWPADQLLSWYEAPVGGLNFNANCLDWLPKVTRNGVGIELIPATSYVSVTVKASRGGENKVWLWRPAGSNKFEMRGTVAASASVPESVTIVEPCLWTGYVARDTFAAAGIGCTGQVRRLAAQDNVKGAQQVSAASTPLLSVIRRANKQSVNMMAESLCKRLGHDATGKPGSWESGTAAVMEYARKCGVGADMISMDDGSGLSAKNRISAKAFTTVLAHVAMTTDGNEFVATLAEPGEDGTLKRRFNGMSVAKAVHAKTGHISGVSTLSGYIDVAETGKSRRFVFSILCNKYSGNVNPVQDQICQAIYEWATRE